MALLGGPNLIDNGVVITLDAANPVSYPGTGTTWYDISGNGNNGTLTNGPTFSSNNGGVITLDGTNDYIFIPNNASFNVADNISIEMWVKIGTSQPNDLGFLIKYSDGYLFYITNDSGHKFAFDSRNGDGTYYRTIGTTNIQDGVWKYLVAQKTGLSYTVYVNGILEGSTTANTVGNISGNVNLSLGTDGGTYLNGQIGLFKIYNRPLSPAEIFQNYNVVKGRFGL
jgi:hypothetical protein